MTEKIKVLCAIGTRPEAIKMAPVMNALLAEDWCAPLLLSTGQHHDLLKPVLTTFSLIPDFELKVMAHGQSLHNLTASILQQSEGVLKQVRPDLVLVHGDTTTAFALALSAFYQGIAIGHVEAGYRTYDLANPYPEEANRSLIARIANLHFAPSPNAVDNLIREGISRETIVLTGNTVIDALLMFASKQPPVKRAPYVVITAHRRENIGAPFARICQAVVELASKNSGMQFIFVLHPNPGIASVARETLAQIGNIRLVDPMEYASFVQLISGAELILSDSGGIQEEGPALGVPVVVMRETTERPEVVDAGLVDVVGTKKERIVAAVTGRLALRDRSNKPVTSPYGDGHASKKVAKAIAHHFGRS